MNKMHLVFTLFAGLAILSLGRGLAESSDEKPRDLDTHHLFTAPSTLVEWKARVAQIRQQLLFSTGLWPMPAKTPLNPKVTGRWEGPDFVVENVALETRPGFYLCGNLYRPKNRKGPFPGIANPHGHWAAGRMHREADVPKADPKAEKPAPGKADLVALPANLAKQGHVVFAYDMVGYNDTNQVDHKFAGTLNAWGWNVSLNGLQTWDSIRVVDYLSSLPYVDKRRIGATGASGGGTQTFLLAAVDDRVKASVPVNMVSSYMQGGCLCENGPDLRVGTDNPEIAATFAPRPQLLISCNGDWTQHVPNEEYPRIKQVYALYTAADKLDNRHFNYGHNYNVESREAMYAFFGKHFLNDPNPEHFREQNVDLDPKVLKVWTEKDPRPSNALSADALLSSMIADTERRVQDLPPGKLAEVVRPALRAALSTPVLAAAKAAGPAQGRKVILVSSSRAWLDQAAKSLEDRRTRLPVLTLEINPGTKPSEKQLWDAFFSTYNQTPLGDAVTAIVNRMVEAQGQHYSRIDLVGDGLAGAWVLFARAATGIPGATVADLSALKGDQEALYLGELYAPGIRATGGWPTAAVLSAPRLTLYGAEGVAGVDKLTSRAGSGSVTVVPNKLTAASVAELAAK